MGGGARGTRDDGRRYEPSNGGKYTYSYICYNSPCPKNDQVSAVACQYDPNQKVDTPLGMVNSETTWEVTDTSDDKFAFTIIYKGGQSGRETHVNFQHTTGEMAMKLDNEKTKDKTYVMEATGSKIQKFRPRRSGKTAIIAGLIVIVIILLAIIGFVTYCIVGGIYMYKVKGARGREMVPQYSFWRGLPLLIKDGFFFTISPCYKRTNYERILLEPFTIMRTVEQQKIQQRSAPVSISGGVQDRQLNESLSSTLSQLAVGSANTPHSVESVPAAVGSELGDITGAPQDIPQRAEEEEEIVDPMSPQSECGV